MTDAGSPIPADAQVLIGRPAIPPSDGLVEQIRAIVASTPGCLEAHLPQVFAIGAMPAPRLALVVVTDPTRDEQEIAAQLNRQMAAISSDEPPFDLWMLGPSDSLMRAIRDARCRL